MPADAFTLTNHRFHVSLSQAEFEALPVIPLQSQPFFADADNLTMLAQRCHTPIDHATLAGNYVLFSALNDDDLVVDKMGEDLGRFVDLWVDFNINEAPYLEYQTLDDDLRTGDTDRYAIPTTKFAGFEDGAIDFNISLDDIKKAKQVENVSTYVATAGEELEVLQMKRARG